MVNKVIFVGRLGADPVVKYTPDGLQMTSFNIASGNTRKDSDGHKITETEWLSCVTWGKLAEICGQYLSKGKLIYVEGRLKTRSWEDKEGVKRYKTEAILSDMKMLGSKSESDGSGQREQNGHTAEGDYDPERDEDIPF